MGSSLLDPLLRDELWICGDAMEDFLGLGAHHAMPFCCADNRKRKKSPQDRWTKYYLEQVIGEVGSKPSPAYRFSLLLDAGQVILEVCFEKGGSIDEERQSGWGNSGKCLHAPDNRRFCLTHFRLV